MNRHIALLSAFAVGCAEVGTAPASDTLQRYQHSSSYLEEGHQNPPENVPPEYQFPTFLHSVEATAGFVDGYGFAQSIVRYTGTNVVAKAVVRTNVGFGDGESQNYQILPRYGEEITSARYYMGTCGETIDATAFGKVWNEFPGLSGNFVSWGTKSRTSHATAQCAATPGPSPGGGGDDGSGRSITCYTLTIDYYVLDLSTGRVIKVGGDVYRWCDDGGYAM